MSCSSSSRSGRDGSCIFSVRESPTPSVRKKETADAGSEGRVSWQRRKVRRGACGFRIGRGGFKTGDHQSRRQRRARGVQPKAEIRNQSFWNFPAASGNTHFDHRLLICLSRSSGRLPDLPGRNLPRGPGRGFRSLKSPGTGGQSHFGAEASGRFPAARSEVKGDGHLPVARTSWLAELQLRSRFLFTGLRLCSGLAGSLAVPLRNRPKS